MNYLEYIKRYNLESDVRKFVYRRIKDIIGGAHNFCFEGVSRFCGNNSPHIPHKIASYNTVRYGELDEFCLGREGKVESGEEIIINVEEFLQGCPEVPTIVKGYWIVKIGRE